LFISELTNSDDTIIGIETIKLAVKWNINGFNTIHVLNQALTSGMKK